MGSLLADETNGSLLIFHHRLNQQPTLRLPLPLSKNQQHL